MTVHQDREIARLCGHGRQHRRRSGDSLGELVASPEEEPVAHGGIDEAGIVGVVGDGEQVGPLP